MTFNSPLDLFVPVADQDVERLPYLVESWRRYFTVKGNLHLIYPSSCKALLHSLPYIVDPYIHLIDEYEMVKPYYTREEWGLIEGWNRQQFLKLLSHKVTRTEWYIVCDATTFFIRPLYFYDLIVDSKYVMHTIDTASNDFLWFDEHVISTTNEILQIKSCSDSYIMEFAVWNKQFLHSLWQYIRRQYSVRSFFDRLNSFPSGSISEWCIYGSYCQHVLGTDLYSYKKQENRINFDRLYMSIENTYHPFYKGGYNFPSQFKIVSLQNRDSSEYELRPDHKELISRYVFSGRSINKPITGLHGLSS